MKFKITTLLTIILILVSCGDDENHNHEHGLENEVIVPKHNFRKKWNAYSGQTTRLNQSDYNALE